MSALGIPSAPELLQEHFGFTTFRTGQREAVEAALAGRDVLAVMPTGAGKSLCYQLPALAADGLTLVVSPLIALMKDQVEALQRRGIPAEALNSSLGPAAQRLVLSTMTRLRLLYLSPERLGSDMVQRALSAVNIARLVVDEAHCISSWGHDFRPDYRRLGAARTQLRNPPITALTATATPRVQDDIAAQLSLQEPARILTGFDRSNLSYRIWPVPNETAKLEALSVLLARRPGPAVVYAGTRARVEALAAQICAWGYRGSAFHAGLPTATREALQNAFLASGDAVMVATNAFGMGIDKGNVRQVIHADLPASVEAYYQEAGRAGRDGAEATCTLLYTEADRERQRGLLLASSPTHLDLKRLYVQLRNSAPDALEARSLGQERGKLVAALQLLEEGGVVRLERQGNRLYARLTEASRAAVPPLETFPVAQVSARKRELLAAMTRYAENEGCRRGELLRYFGETPLPLPCGCDRCMPTFTLTASSMTALQGFKRAKPPERGDALPEWLAQHGYLEPRRRLWGHRYGLSARGLRALEGRS